MDRPFFCFQGPAATHFLMMEPDLCLPDDYRSDDSRRLDSLSPFEDG